MRPADTRSATILLVEDEPSIRELMARRLSRGGFLVLQAANGQEALAVADRYADVIELLVSDVVMPIMDGFTLHERLVARFPGMKVLLMSGYAHLAVAVRGGLHESGLPFILKPFTPEELERAVLTALASSGAPPASGKGPASGDTAAIHPARRWRH